MRCYFPSTNAASFPWSAASRFLRQTAAFFSSTPLLSFFPQHIDSSITDRYLLSFPICYTLPFPRQLTTFIPTTSYFLSRHIVTFFSPCRYFLAPLRVCFLPPTHHSELHTMTQRYSYFLPSPPQAKLRCSLDKVYVDFNEYLRSSLMSDFWG